MGWSVFIDDPVPYDEGVRIQEVIHRARLEDRIPDTVLFLEHRPVITRGRRGRDNFLLSTPEDLAAKGIDYHVSSRGGDITWHGPGQVVMYPIIRLGTHEADTHGYLHNLEEVAIRTCGDYGVKAWRREGKSGAWTDAGKIAAIGFKIQRRVTLHGISFNVRPELSGFQLIVPCGLAGEPVCSLQTILGNRCPSVQEARCTMQRHVQQVLDRTLEPRTLEQVMAEA